METHTLGVLGAISSLVALPGMAVSAAATFQPGVPTAHSYAELLEPIPNAVERLKIADAQGAAGQPRLIKAQYFLHIRGYYRPHYRYRRHYRYGYFPRYIPYAYPYYHHHHHHHHHHHSNY